jgi:exopolysaccharide production protein ExoQ
MSLQARRAVAPLLTIAAFLIGPIGFLAPLGLAPLLIVVALGLAAVAALERRLPAPPIDLAVALSLLCTIGLASVVWAIDPQHSLERALRLVGECVEGVLLLDAADRLDAVERRRILAGLALGLGVTIVLSFADAWFARGLMRWLHGPRTAPTASNRGATVLALMMWPALLFLARTRSRWFALGGWVLAALGIVVCLAASAHLALAAASVTFLAALLLRQAAARALLVLAPAAVLVMPIVPLLTPPDQPLLPRTMLKPSAMHRLVIWHFTDTRIADKPLLGWGLDSARAMPGGKDFTFLPGAPGQVERYEQLPLHPHNGALQVWLELGAVGALVGALVVVVMLSRLTPATLAPATRAAGLAAFVAAAIEVSLSYGIWQSWWIAALWFTSFTVVLLRDAPQEEIHHGDTAGTA